LDSSTTLRGASSGAPGPYSQPLERLGPDALRDFIPRELDRVGLGHDTFTGLAVDLIVRSANMVQIRETARRSGFPAGPDHLPVRLESRTYGLFPVSPHF
jgi:hypothetical protein